MDIEISSLEYDCHLRRDYGAAAPDTDSPGVPHAPAIGASEVPGAALQEAAWSAANISPKPAAIERSRRVPVAEEPTTEVAEESPTSRLRPKTETPPSRGYRGRLPTPGTPIAGWLCS